MEVVEVEKLGCVVGVLWVVCSCLVLCWRIPTDGGSCLFVCFYRHYFLVFLPRLHLISSLLVSLCLVLSSSNPVFCILDFTCKSFCLQVHVIGPVISVLYTCILSYLQEVRIPACLL